MASAEQDAISQTGSCHCGKVEFIAEGKISMSAFCHCKNCCRARGVSPLHLIGVSPASGVRVTKGEEFLKTHGTTVTRVFCSECGCIVHMGPVDAAFRAVSPVTFKIDGLLPATYQPKVHMNYESRTTNWHDDLPKFLEWPGGVRVNNTGEAMKE
mmetsp:Transcript_33826/g.46834  ORF Transcript_33826/g.46834 Transcript_33826/m.46834 type:complete len:155 (+) Transcript_33826:110-574(+)